MPVIVPLTSGRNLTPSSTAAESLVAICAGVADALQMLQGHPTGVVIVTATPPLGVSRLPLSSMARLMIVLVPVLVGVQAKLQFSRPVAGCHVLPPSTDTSTPPTTPPPASVALPVTVIGVPTGMFWPLTGNPTVDVGGVRSVLALAGERPGCSVPGCAAISANKLTVACCMSVLAAGPALSCVSSSPHPQRMVPAPKTRAPLA